MRTGASFRTSNGAAGNCRRNHDKMRECIESNLNPDGIFLDYAAGYGLFVRLMRDAGYNFRWSDLYCQNLLFEALKPLNR